MVDVETKGSRNRIKNCALDLLSLANDLIDDEESWDLIARDLRLKSTFMFCDFSKMIASAPQDQKKALAEVANKLFYSIEELDHAVKIRSMSLTQDRYNDAAVILQEVLALMP